MAVQRRHQKLVCILFSITLLLPHSCLWKQDVSPLAHAICIHPCRFKIAWSVLSCWMLILTVDCLTFKARHCCVKLTYWLNLQFLLMPAGNCTACGPWWLFSFQLCMFSVCDYTFEEKMTICLPVMANFVCGFMKPGDLDLDPLTINGSVVDTCHVSKTLLMPCAALFVHCMGLSVRWDCHSDAVLAECLLRVIISAWCVR